MEEEVERKTFYKKDYKDAYQLEKAAEMYAIQMRKNYPECMVTKEYVNVVNILVRVTTIRQLYRTDRILERERERQKQRERQREIGRGRGGRSRTR